MNAGSNGLPDTPGVTAPDAAGRGVAVLLPCYNEAPTIAKVVANFRAALPHACIYVFDNNSTDATADQARAAGGMVVPSPLQGKGHVVQHMFRTIDADYYVIADGDDTYPADAAPQLLDFARQTGADMVVGTRLHAHQPGAFRTFHQFGNRLITGLIAAIFKVRLKDVLSGYRVLSRNLVRSLPLNSPGFEIEAEMTIQSLAKGFIIRETPIQYGSRPPGSYSKLSTWGDGLLIVKLILTIAKDYKPMTFFGAVAVLLALGSIAAGIPPVMDYITTRYVAHVPLAVLAAGLGIISVLCAAIGLILHTIRNYHHESFELWCRIARQLDQRDDQQLPRR